MDWELMWDSVPALLAAVPLTLQLVALALLLGLGMAALAAWARLSGHAVAAGAASAYVFVFRGTPLLVQIFLIYYGLSQFEAVRASLFWPLLREPYWCAILALMLNTGAYQSEIIRGAILSVPQGQVEAARACGMSRLLLFRRIVLPVAVRQALPAYGNEIILMVKASSLASTITLLEITGVARRIISQTYAVFEIFIVAGILYLLINFAAARLIRWAEWRMTPHLRARV
ncbi:ABC transporter permease subunit [Azospirillum sp. RWY-5-1]|uniref:ABC transporter permease subunit n=1 Tax=Azospirillum oleiclasticum TaxID=2735135 RepID=A0ABX2TAL1_9PROT|nr:ABC transporter permease subunit [Azospirillum oleiclasticum]NYZ15353.1 ABC transporter permease subunit [Azospirillum oleiclasticum]NYZ21226.1 ABC transporter permease subunit [Azospirillum oleiclasticum]